MQIPKNHVMGCGVRQIDRSFNRCAGTLAGDPDLGLGRVRINTVEAYGAGADVALLVDPRDKTVQVLLRILL